MQRSPAARVLVIEDDRKTAATVALYLRHEGFEVTLAHDGSRGLALAREGGHDLLLLDLMLPGVDGRELCRRVRETADVPVIMLTARAGELERVHGLDLGADDYVTKPFSPRELMARVRAVLRRRPPRRAPREEVLRAGGLTVNLSRHTVRRGNEPIELTPTEFRLLAVLLRAPARVFRREELLAVAFGPDFRGTDRTVDAHIKNLRAKIEPDRHKPSLIGTVFGIGYRFEGARDAR